MEPTAREILGPRPLMREIAEEVCQQHGLTLELLTGSSRKRTIAWPRQTAYRRCHEMGYSPEQIAKFFGRDPTTVIYGIRCARWGWVEHRKATPVIPSQPKKIMPRVTEPTAINYRKCQQRWEDKAAGVWFGARPEFSPRSTYSCRDRSNTVAVTCAILGE